MCRYQERLALVVMDHPLHVQIRDLVGHHHVQLQHQLRVHLAVACQFHELEVLMASGLEDLALASYLHDQHRDLPWHLQQLERREYTTQGYKRLVGKLQACWEAYHKEHQEEAVEHHPVHHDLLAEVEYHLGIQPHHDLLDQEWHQGMASVHERLEEEQMLVEEHQRTCLVA